MVLRHYCFKKMSPLIQYIFISKFNLDHFLDGRSIYFPIHFASRNLNGMATQTKTGLPFISAGVNIHFFAASRAA